VTTQQDMSPTIGKLAEALAKAQAKIKHAEKDGRNDFYKKNGDPSKYSTLTSVWDACKEPLCESGLAVTQLIQDVSGFPYLTTMLIHSSGEWLRSCVPLKAKETNMQGLGSAITYARRFGLSSIVGIFPDEDDDGESSEGRGEGKKYKATDVAAEKVTSIKTPAVAFSVKTEKSLHDQLKKAIEGNDSALSQILEFNKVSSIEEMSEDQCNRALNSFLKHKVRKA
jgi:hypothetical protein